MMLIRNAILLLLMCLCVGCSSSPEDKAIQAFRAGDYDAADKLLTEERLKLPAARYTLDKAYILRGVDKLKFSTAQLEQAMSLLQAGTPLGDPVRREIYLNMFLNSYLENNLTRLQSDLETAKNAFPPDDPWYLLFKGLNAYLQGNYQGANADWKNLKAPTYMSPWMEISFSKVFPETWLQNLQSRAAIFSGDFRDIRQRLEKDLKSGSADKEQTLFLLGLTYVQEARERGPAAALPYYKIAFNYFDQIPDIQKKFPQDLFYLNLLLLKDIRVIIASQNFTDLPFYIDSVQKWGTKEQVQELAKAVTDQLFALIAKERWGDLRHISPALDDLIVDPEVRDYLSRRYEELTEETLKKGEVSAAEKLASLARLFNSNPVATDNRIASEVQVHLFNQLKSENPSFKTSQQLLELWKSLEGSPSQRMQLADRLLTMSKSFWSTRGGEENAIAIMRLAESAIPSNRQAELKQSMERVVDVVYASAIAQSDFDKLKYILEAQKIFSLDPAVLTDPKEIANLEADAQLLYKQRNYAKAFLVAEWIANLQPNLETVQRLAGLSAYQLGNYPKALEYLKKLPSRGDVLPAQAVAEIVTGNAAEGRKLLAQIGSAADVPAEVYERLAIADLLKGDAPSALGWIIESPNQSDKLRVIQLLTLYHQGDNDEVLKIYRKLPRPYQELSFINSVAALAAMRLDEIEEAEDLIRDLYDNEKPDVVWKDLAFQKLLENSEFTPSKYYAGAMYYKTIVKNPTKAAEQFSKIPSQSLETAVEYAETLIALGKNREAYELLRKMDSQLDKSPTATQWRDRFLKLYALVHQKLGATIESYEAWQGYFAVAKKKALDPAILRSYVQTLLDLRLYSSVEPILKKIPAKSLLAEDLLDIVDARVHLGDFKAANQIADSLLDVPNQLPNVKLRIAKAMKVTKDKQLYNKAMYGLPASKDLDAEAAISLLDILIFNADYQKALELYKSRQSEWEKDPAVQVLLYRLYEGLSDSGEAKKAAIRAGLLAPNNYAYSNFRVQYGDDDPFISLLEKKYRPLYDKEELSASPSLQYALALQEEALEEYLSGKTPDINQTPSLHMSARVLVGLTRKYSTLPELQYYYGQALYLLGQKSDALSAFQTAISLDPSYADAYLHAGLIYGDDNNHNKAAEMFKKAVQFAPDNGRAWQKLGKAEELLGNYLDALLAYNQATLYHPRESANFVSLGALQLQLNNPEAAVVALEKAVDLQDEDPKTLQLLLTALYDPNLQSQRTAVPNLSEKQHEVYEKLYKLNPQEAVELKKKLITGWNK